MATPEEYAQWAEWENWNKYQASLAPTPAAPAEPSFWDGLTSNIGGKILDTGESLLKLPGTIAKNYFDPSPPVGVKIPGVVGAVANTLYTGVQSGTDVVKRTGSLVGGALPGGSTGVEAAFDAATGQLKPSEYYGDQLSRELIGYGTSAALGALAKPAYRAARGTLTGVRDWAAGGLPEKEALVRQAGRPDIYANKLDFGRSKVKGENVQIQAAADTSDAFFRENPVAGIDNTLLGEEQIAQFQNNLRTIESKAIRTRAEILPKVAEAQEAAAANGISTTIRFEDIPKSFKTDAGELGLNTLRARYGDTPVGLADDFMKQEFGMVQEYVGPAYEGAPMQMAPSRALSVEDANFLRQKIDGQIQALGGYDTSYWANKGLDPSVADGYAEALGFYRKQLDGVVKGRIKSVLGDDVATAFTKAGENISMTKTYSPMLQRFATGTGEAFTPGSAKSAPPGQGPYLGRNGNAVVDTLVPGRAEARVVTQGLEREANAIRQLQQLIDFRMNQTKPIPRGWAQIKNSFQDLTNIGNIAMSMGIIGSIAELTQMPDDQAKQVLGAIASTAPGLFEQTPDKVDVFDNQFLNPMQKDGLTRQALEKDPKTRYKVIGQGTTQNKYVPLATELPEAVKPAQQAPGIGQLNSMLSGGAPTLPTAPAVSDSSNVIRQLEDAVSRHSQDYVQ